MMENLFVLVCLFFCKQRIQIATLVFWAGIWVGILHGFGIFFLRTFVDLSGHWIIWSVRKRLRCLSFWWMLELFLVGIWPFSLLLLFFLPASFTECAGLHHPAQQLFSACGLFFFQHKPKKRTRRCVCEILFTNTQQVCLKRIFFFCCFHCVCSETPKVFLHAFLAVSAFHILSFTIEVPSG